MFFEPYEQQNEVEKLFAKRFQIDVGSFAPLAVNINVLCLSILLQF